MIMSTSNEKIVPVILSGGSGTRLWPLSRAYYPKQLQPLHNKNSLLQEHLFTFPFRERVNYRDNQEAMQCQIKCALNKI